MKIQPQNFSKVKITINFSKTQRRNLANRLRNWSHRKIRGCVPRFCGGGVNQTPRPAGKIFTILAKNRHFLPIFLKELKGDTGGRETSPGCSSNSHPGHVSRPPCRPLLFPLLCSLLCVNLASYACENKHENPSLKR